MNFDEIFVYIGEIGVYQIFLYVLLGLPSYFAGYMSISMSFLGYTPEHWCSVPRLEDFPHDQQKYVGIPPATDDEDLDYEECSFYDLPYDNLTDDEIWNWEWNSGDYYRNTTDELECDSWVYDQSVFVSTAVTEFDLVCGDQFKISLVSTIYYTGVLFGAPLSGVLSDVFGRKLVLLTGSAGHFVVAFLSAYSPNYAAFVSLRFLFSIFSTFAYLTAFVIVMEFIGPRYRTVAGVFYQIWFSIGFMCLSGYAYVARDFKNMQLVFAIPIALSVCYVWLCPESPRWLVSKERYDEAEKILRHVAEVNQREMPEKLDLKPDPDEAEIEKGKFIDLFKYPILRKEILVIYLGWFTNSLVYYGLSLNTGTLSGDIFLNSFISAFVEVPANIICIFTMIYLGRKPTLVGAFLIAGVSALMCIPFLENDDLADLVTTLTMIGKAAITASFSVIYVYTAELFPTPVRHIAVGSSSMMARIGGLIAPFMGEPLMSIWVPMPSVIFGFFGIASGLVSLLLPETLGKTLPDTIQDAEDIGRKNKVRVEPIEQAVETDPNFETEFGPPPYEDVPHDKDGVALGKNNGDLPSEIPPKYEE